VLALNPVDKYHPRKTGVFNIYIMDELEDKSYENPKRLNQLWYYNSKRKALLSRRYPTKAMFEGFNRNLVVWQFRNVRNQIWSYDMNHHNWFNDFSKHALAIEKDGNIITKPMDNSDKE